MTVHRLRVAALVGGLLVLGFAADLVIRPGGHRGVVWVDDLGTLVAVLLALGATLSARRRAAPARPPRLDVARRGPGGVGFRRGGRGRSTSSGPARSRSRAWPMSATSQPCRWSRWGSTSSEPATARPGGRVSCSTGWWSPRRSCSSSWVSVLGPVFRSGSGDVLSQAVAIAYPAGDVLIATMVLSTVTRARRFRGNPLVPIGLGLLLMAISDSVYAALVQAGTYTTGNLIDVGWVAAYLLIGLAALAPGHACRSAAAEGRRDASRVGPHALRRPRLRVRRRRVHAGRPAPTTGWWRPGPPRSWP